VVKGLDVFLRWFADHSDQYVLIGGTAASLAMEDAGLEYRATKDLDVVLHVENLTPAFGARFWQFIETGGYGIRQASDTTKPTLYRFQKPTDANFPVMVELFSHLGGATRSRRLVVDRRRSPDSAESHRLAGVEPAQAGGRIH